MRRSVWLGWDARETAAFAVARLSLRRHMGKELLVEGVILGGLRHKGLYNRPTEHRKTDAGNEIMWDMISDAPMATEHACARFLVPHLAKDGWALFCDGDVLFRADVNELFDALDPSKALYCVQHRHEPPVGVKMDGQMQVRYARKNWSSVMAFNCGHPANAALTVDLVNSVPGRDLHRFCWLNDADIGALGSEWNYLVGTTDRSIEPKIVHFTDGVPNMPGYENVEYADEWRAELTRA